MSNPNIRDKDILLVIAFSCPVIYLTTSLVFTNSQLPTLLVVFLGCNMFSRTKYFTSFVQKLEPQVSKLLENDFIPTIFNGPGRGLLSGMINTDGSSPAGNSNHAQYESLSETSKIELISAVKSLQAYSANSKRSNERHKKLFKMMTWRQQKLCEDVGYVKRLSKIDQAVNKNQSFMTEIANHAIDMYGLSYQDFEILKDNKNSKNNSSSLNYRVVEALGHFVRDWTKEGELELKYLMDNIKTELDRIIPSDQRGKTCVVIPGSGLGRIAHDIANLGKEYGSQFASVQAVEYSGLMNVCNSFIYNNNQSADGKGTDLEIFPYIHSSSNIVKSSSQFRSSKIDRLISKPANLQINHDDFRYFEIPDSSKYDNVVVLSVFFVDTAENLIEYLDAIKSITSNKNVKRGYWINLGPLKYGSAAQAELTAEELCKVRKAMGWNDLRYVNTIEDDFEEANNSLVGYITDTQSMWQGYYGLSMWTSERKENSL